jgi:hypothetical protein
MWLYYLIDFHSIKLWIHSGDAALTPKYPPWCPPNRQIAEATRPWRPANRQIGIYPHTRRTIEIRELKHTGDDRQRVQYNSGGLTAYYTVSAQVAWTLIDPWVDMNAIKFRRCQHVPQIEKTQQQCLHQLVISPNSLSMYVLSLMLISPIDNGQQNPFNS